MGASTIPKKEKSMKDEHPRSVRQAVEFARRTIGIMAICLCLGLFTHRAIGQEPGQTQPKVGQEETPTFGLPARAPGYELYYRNEDRTLAFATRWGYFDGWRDGKHDSELAISKLPTDQDRYKLVPDHGLHPGIPRTEYKTAYRTAYLHGYDHATKAVNGTAARAPQ